MKTRLRFFALLAALTMIAAACADDGGGDAETGDDATDEANGEDGEDTDDAAAPTDEDEDGELRRLRQGLFGADVGSIDPHQAVPAPDRAVVMPIFEGLVRYVPGDAAAGFEPDLATEIPEPPAPEDDGTQIWEFELNEGVMCQAGPENDAYELSIEEVVASYEKSMDADRSSFAGDYGNVQSVEATGDRTIAFTLAEARSAELFLPLVADIASGYVVCMDAYEAMGGQEAFSQHPVGTGPYQVVEYTPGEGVTLDAFDEYWRGTPGLAGIDLRFMADSSSRELALRSGEVDLIIGIDEADWVQRINAEDGLTAFAIPVGGLQFFEMNQTMEPFDDLNVRRAILWAHNREQHLALAGQVDGEPFFSPAYTVAAIPGGPGDVGPERVLEAGLDWIVEYDPERASELLAEAGYPDGFSFDVVTSEHELYRDNYEIQQSALAELGIEMNVDVVDHPTMHSTIREGANAIVWYTAPRPTTDQLLFQFLHSQSIVVEGENPITNFAYYDGVDGLIEEAQAELDADRQEELWIEASFQAMEDAVVGPSAHPVFAYAHTDDLDLGHEPRAYMHSTTVTVNENTTFTD